MSIRSEYEQLERRILSPYAMCAADSRGRRIPEQPCPIRTAFQRDRDRIIHSKSFRRLKHKTQVFINPTEDHFRTRLTHTLEVSQISRTIARALRLNEDLTEAIALGHDLGHTPFGHIGESELTKCAQEYIPDFVFKHNEQSLRVVEKLEKNGAGLNLTYEVLDGILLHSKGLADLNSSQNLPYTLEGQIVRISDRIAYINHDIDDAVLAGIIGSNDLPDEAVQILGATHKDRISHMVIDIIDNSKNSDIIKISSQTSYAIDMLKDFLFQKVYNKTNEKHIQAKKIITKLFLFYMQSSSELLLKNTDINVCVRNVCDFISGMTDSYAIDIYKKTLT